ncbi:hypothetical protein HC000_01960 [Pseudoalteromonas sp. MIP2626]|uniref:pyocin knob domain-containing protein n=1 Tax=Pseudoalteromonas sp. MIP2626 TaxID=2705464 RepID=UPI0015CC4C3D|nr:pyocin knob domain-containing protein [Pseudoalteromonas sp. MIP2626]NYR11264.1 hypothetical protein [Pseudoalteromonas sp. MIP2626]
MSAIKINGTWQRVSAIKIKKGGVWVDHTALYARLEGAWHLIDLGAEAKGPAYHVWKAYADDAYGVGISLDPTDKTYLGLATGQTVAEPNLSDPTIFDWSLIKGKDGVDVDQTVLDEIQTTTSNTSNRVSTLEQTSAHSATRITSVETKATLIDGKVSTAQKAADAADAKAVAAGKIVTTVSNRVGMLEQTGVDNASRLTNVETKSTTAVTNAATAQAQADKGVTDAADAKLVAGKSATDAAAAKLTADSAVRTVTEITSRVGTLEKTSLDSASRLTNVETTSNTAVTKATAAKLAADAAVQTVKTVNNRVTILEETSLDSASRITTVETTSSTAVAAAAAAKAKADKGVLDAAAAQAKAEKGVADAAAAQAKANTSTTNAAAAKVAGDKGIADAKAAKLVADKGVLDAAAAQAKANKAATDLVTVTNRVTATEKTDAAHASRLTAVETKSNATSSKVTVLEKTTSDSATRIEAVNTQRGKDIAASTSTAKTYTDQITGAIKAERVIKADANGKVSGVHMIATGSGADAGGKLYFQADEIAIVPPSWNGVTELDKTKFPFYFSEDRNSMYLDEATIKKLSAEIIDSGRLVVDGLSLMTKDLSLPAGSITGDMLDASFKDGLVRVNPNGAVLGGTVSKEVRGVAYGTSLKLPALKSGGNVHTINARIVAPNGNDRISGHINVSLFVNGAALKFNDGFVVKKVEIEIEKKLVGGPSQYYVYVSSVNFSEQIITPARVSGTDYVYEMRVVGVHVNDTSYAAQYSLSFSASEPVKSSGGFITDVNWNEVKSKPAQATRWPSWGEVGGKPALALANQVLTNVPAGAKFTDTNTHRAISDSVATVNAGTSASLTAVKTAYDRGTSALNTANTKLAATAKAVDSAKLEGQAGSFYAKSSQVLTNVPAGAKFTDTNTHRAISDSVASVNAGVSASSTAVKTAYDKGVDAKARADSAYNLANGKLGAGSKAVDSDKLGGLNSSSFVKTARLEALSSASKVAADTWDKTGINYSDTALFGSPDGALYANAYSSVWQHQIYGDYRSGNIAVRGKNNGVWQPWRTVWSSGNDGAGSGLDADLLDGQQGSFYAKASQVLTNVPAGAKFTDTNTHRAISDSISTVNAGISASLTAVKSAYDRGTSALNVANTKLGATAKAVDSAKLEGRAAATFANAAHTHAGHDVKTLGHRLSVDSDGKIRSNHTDYRRAGMYGIYDPARIDHIWSMGTAYQIPANGANFGNLYGLAYKHTNNATGGTMAGGHQMVWVVSGAPKAAMGESGLWSASAITAGGEITANGFIRANGGLIQDGHVVLNGTDTWLRSKGSDGWHSTSYGGGIHMTDGTWVRVYGGKGFYVSNTSNSSINTAGGVMGSKGYRRDNLGSSWISQKDTEAVGLYNSTPISTSSYAAVVRQKHASHTYTLGGLGNAYFGFFSFHNTKTANGSDGHFRMDVSGNCEASGVMKVKATNNTISRVLTYDDFLPANPPAGLENTITANWIGAGAINARHLQVTSIVKAGTAYTSFKVAPDAERPISLSKTDSAGNEVEPIFYVDTKGNGYFKGKLSKGTVDIESIQEEARKQINPYYLGTVAGGSQGDYSRLSMTSGTSSSLPFVRTVQGKVNLAWTLGNASKITTRPANTAEGQIPSWRVEIFKGSVSGTRIVNKTYWGDGHFSDVKGVVSGWQNIHIEDSYTDTSAAASQVYAIRVTYLTGRMKNLFRTLFTAHSPAFKQMRVGYEYTTLYYAPAGTGWGDLPLSADYDKFEFLAVSGSDGKKNWQGVTIIPTHHITHDAGITVTKHFLMQGMGYDSFWKGIMSGKRLVKVVDANSLVYRVWGVNMVEKV